MKNFIKSTVTALLLAAIVMSTASCGIVSNIFGGNKDEQFYELVYDTQILLDELGNYIYSNWSDCIYEEKFDGDINEAIEDAFDDNEEMVDIILANNEEIERLYKKVKDGDLGSEAKDVMTAYNDYYALVMEDQGSFNSYSAALQPARRALSSALKSYKMELD